jgi:hypothetical protein
VAKWGVEIGHIDQVIAAELLLGLGEGPSTTLVLAIFDADRGGRGGRPQPVGGDPYLGVAQRLRVGHI